jgi:hypothetical protein
MRRIYDGNFLSVDFPSAAIFATFRPMMIEGFEDYRSTGKSLTRKLDSPFARVSDECHIISPSHNISLCRQPSGRWKLTVNGVEMIFERRPEFVIHDLPD